MNIPGNPGNSSSKRQENGDQTMECERPLKKARFAWQVKGKYHLKNETSQNNASSIISKDQNEASSSSESDSNDLVGNTEQNLEILGDYLLKQDFNTLDSVIAETDTSLLPGTSSPSEKLEYPRYVSSYIRKSNNNIRKSSSESSYSALPMSMVQSHVYSEDQCIARWQARQVAKGFVDNTINRVLDSWLVAPLPADVDNNRFLALGVAEFINNLPGDNTIENEGILMAISAHGLQNTSSSSSCNIDDTIHYNSVNKSEGYISPRSSPIPSEEDVPHKSLELNSESGEDVGSSTLDMSWSYSEDTMRKSMNDLTHLALFPDTSTQYKYFNETDNLQTANIEYDNVGANNSDVDSHFDFLDAAVTYAIQNKGLTSFGTEYG